MVSSFRSRGIFAHIAFISFRIRENDSVCIILYHSEKVRGLGFALALPLRIPSTRLTNDLWQRTDTPGMHLPPQLQLTIVVYLGLWDRARPYMNRNLVAGKQRYLKQHLSPSQPFSTPRYNVPGKPR